MLKTLYLYTHMTTNKPLNKTFLIILLGILAAIGPFTIDMYLPGFAQIANEFNTDAKKVAFTLTSYFVGIAIGQLIYGPLVDKYGRKKPLLFGLGLYAVAALGCGLSSSIESLIAMRLLQALGGCVGMVASNAIISDVYPKEKRAKAFSMIMLVMGVAPVIAPTVGSIFMEIGSWHYIFFFLAVFALFVFTLILIFLPETSQYIHNNKLVAKDIANNYLSILKNKTFLFYTLAGSISMSILFAYISSASFIFQNLYGLSEREFAVIFAINACGLILGNTVNGFLVGKINYIEIARIASILISISATIVVIIFATFPSLPYTAVVGGIFIILFLVNFINPNATAASLAPFTVTAGAASALAGSIRMGIGAMVAAAVGVFQGESALTMFVIFLLLSVLVMIMLLLGNRQKGN